MAEESEFEHFAEASTLYADYAAVIEQVRQAFLADVNLFLDGLRERIGTQVPLAVQESRDDRKAIRRWWLSNDENSQYIEHLYVWITSNATKIVRPGILEVSPWVCPAFKAFRHQIVAVKDTIRPPSSCQIKKGVAGSPFTVAVSIGTNDPVGEAAAPIGELLTSLLDLERRLPTAKP